MGINTKASAAERWQLPSVDPNQRKDPDRPLTAAELEAIHKQAYDEGFERGRKDGMIAGQSEVQVLQRRMSALLQTLATPLEDLDDEIIQQLVILAVTVARQIIRRELSIEPDQVVAVVREALNALPAAARDVRISLRPEDAALIRENLSLNDVTDLPWRLVEDPAIAHGDCRIQAENSTIDASVEKRLNQVITGLLGGERDTDMSTD